MTNERKHHSPEEKVAILHRHLIDWVPVSALCEEHQLHPAVFHRWLKQFFENGAPVSGPTPCAIQRRAFLFLKGWLLHN